MAKCFSLSLSLPLRRSTDVKVLTLTIAKTPLEFHQSYHAASIPSVARNDGMHLDQWHAITRTDDTLASTDGTLARTDDMLSRTDVILAPTDGTLSP